MHSTFTLAYRYLMHWITASSGKGHGIHSPFVYDFVRNVLMQPSCDPRFNTIEAVRSHFLQDHSTTLPIEDRGAGSRTTTSSVRSVSSIARSALKPSRYAQLLHRMIRHCTMDGVLELGTSLGITTRYLSAAQPKNGVTSIEGAPALAAFTAERLQKEGYDQVTVLTGDFSEHLERVLSTMHGSKLIFMDGNHQYQPTMEYFHTVVRYINEEDILVVDDIHWSAEMEKAWEDLKKNEQATCFVDLFFMGIVFFRKDFKEKQCFAIRF